MKKKTLLIFLCTGVISLISGLFLLYKNARPYGVGFTCLGVVWIMICFGQAQKMNKDTPM